LTRVAAALVAYHGGPFRGFAVNPGVRTVAGDLQDALARVLRAPVVLTGAGRTDAGVHAWGQVVSFDAPEDTDLARVARSVNGLAGPAIAMRAIAWAPDGFDARFSATSRSYRYTLLRSQAPNPFFAPTAWHVPERLDVQAMTAAAAAFVGEHDFRSFCRAKQVLVDGQEVEASSVRHVTALDLVPADDDCLRIDITASSFCHQMVRSITGTLVDIGRGRRRADAVPAMLAARDRHAAGNMAPAHGLCLWGVGYDELDPFVAAPGLPGPGSAP
jgi:tRNA pseudouridine38-40 synthase